MSDSNPRPMAVIMPPPIPTVPPVNPPVVQIAEARAKKTGRWRGQDIVESTPEALWPGYLYRGGYTLLSGDSGVGKGFFLADLVARATRGGPFPEQGAGFAPLRCLILASEDSKGTFKERLVAAGADHANYEIDESMPSLSSLVTNMEGFDLVCLETLDVHLDSSVRGNDNMSVRNALQPWINQLKRQNSAGFGVKHWTKNEQRTAVNRASGAGAFVQASRAALSIAITRTKARYLMVDKCNLAIEPYPLRFTLGPGNIEWQGYDSTAMPGLRPELASAVTMVLELLADGAKPAKVILAAARQASISQRLLGEARVYLQIVTWKAGFPGVGYWSLPTMETDGPPEMDFRTLGEEPAEWDPEDL